MVCLSLINNYILQNSQNLPIPEENTIVEIHSVLSSFISSNAEAWAPIISAWSLDLLGICKQLFLFVSYIIFRI